MQDSQKPEQRPVHEGPSWGLMLLAILVAILLALAIAWAFITPLLHPHHPH
ncbi:MAG TPA: hypothetical protein VFJ10_17185 [Acidobacteriaceae bacterium]|nr:hypothetical protein [Acidobacteriaceae bacterium]